MFSKNRLIARLVVAAFSLLSVGASPTSLSAQTESKAPAVQQQYKPEYFTFQEVMVPMRDGVRLQTVILTPKDQKEPLPIILRRTPYGVPQKERTATPPSVPEAYILVFQNIRGRFKSE